MLLHELYMSGMGMEHFMGHDSAATELVTEERDCQGDSQL